MILTYIETRDKKIKKSSLEVLSEARRIAAELKTEAAAVLLGTGMEALAADLSSYGASKVHLFDSTPLDRYSTQDHAAALASLVKKLSPAAVFFSATAMGKDLAPRLAGRVGGGVGAGWRGASGAHPPPRPRSQPRGQVLSHRRGREENRRRADFLHQAGKSSRMILR